MMMFLGLVLACQEEKNDFSFSVSSGSGSAQGERENPESTEEPESQPDESGLMMRKKQLHATCYELVEKRRNKSGKNTEWTTYHIVHGDSPTKATQLCPQSVFNLLSD